MSRKANYGDDEHIVMREHFPDISMDDLTLVGAGPQFASFGERRDFLRDWVMQSVESWHMRSAYGEWLDAKPSLKDLGRMDFARQKFVFRSLFDASLGLSDFLSSDSPSENTQAETEA